MSKAQPQLAIIYNSLPFTLPMHGPSSDKTDQAPTPYGLMARQIPEIRWKQEATTDEVFFHLGPTGHTTSGSASTIAVAGYYESIWQFAAIPAFPVAVFDAGSVIDVGYDPIRAMAKLAPDFGVVVPSVAQRLALTPPAVMAAKSLLHSYAQFEFEDGMEDDFTPQLTELIRGNAQEAIQAIRQEIITGRLDPEYIWHILRRLGAIDDPLSHSARLSLLQECLSFSSRWIRDGAALGLVVLRDRSAIASLKRAIELEVVPDLQDDLSKALKRLETEA